MKMSGEEIIAADRATVWAALNDPDVLEACIPGCKSLEKRSDTELAATVSLGIGPVRANFDGEVELKDLNPPESYRLEGEGKGGVAGFASGGADVRLEEVPEGTRLTYEVDAKVGGKIAQVGARLIDSTAKKLAKKFFADFKARVEGDGKGETE